MQLFFLRWSDACSVLLAAKDEAEARALGVAHSAATLGGPPVVVAPFPMAGFLVEVFDDSDDLDEALIVVEPDEKTASRLAVSERFDGFPFEDVGTAQTLPAPVDVSAVMAAAGACPSRARGPGGDVVPCDLTVHGSDVKHRHGKLVWS